MGSAMKLKQTQKQKQNNTTALGPKKGTHPTRLFAKKRNKTIFFFLRFG